MGLFNNSGFTKGQKVYVPWMKKYGRITQIRGGLIRVNINGEDIMVKPHEIRDGE
jgi:hypothetical protein